MSPRRLAALLSLVPIACHGAGDTATQPRASTRARASPTVRGASSSSELPREVTLVIGDRLVDATDGRIVGKIEGALPGAQALPVGPDRFLVGDRMIDVASGERRRVWPAATIENAPNKEWAVTGLLRREDDGRVRWRVPLHGARSVRPPDVLVAGGRVVAVVDDAILAFDDTGGAPSWKAPGPADRMVADDQLVFTTDCGVHGPPRWLVGRHLENGKEAFRSELPGELDPVVWIDPEHLVVVDSKKDHEITVVFDHAGHRLFELHEAPFGSLTGAPLLRPIDGDLLVVSDKRIARLDASGRTRWERSPPTNAFVGAADVVELSGGDLLVADSCLIGDSGVDLVRIRRGDGASVWESNVPGLGVAHSAYSHVAYIHVRGERLYVVSQGSSGSFFERVALGTGLRELRCRMGPGGASCAAP